MAQRDHHVLAIAERLFLEKGYHQVSLALVATSAGVATRTIYTSFGEKQVLLLEILECRRDAAELALAELAGQRLDPEQTLHRLAAHAFTHALSPCLALLQADLLAERCELPVSSRRWSEEGEWRVLLERVLTPASATHADVFVACLMSEHLATQWPCIGAEPTAQLIDAMARRTVARFRAMQNVAGLSVRGPSAACRSGSAT